MTDDTDAANLGSSSEECSLRALGYFEAFEVEELDGG